MNRPPTSDPAPDTWYWDRYWRSDRLAACCHADDQNYSDAIRRLWEGFFADTPNGARLLDIGTGNGAVPLLAVMAAEKSGRRFEIHGVDRAAIDPERFLPRMREQLHAVTFHAHTAAESLPFNDGAFDRVTGQYALEYTGVPATLRELHRVTCPGAQLCFVVHAREGSTVQGAELHLREMQQMLDDTAILDKARALMRTTFDFERSAVRDSAREAAARQARESYRRAAAVLDARYPSSPCPEILADVLNTVRSDWDGRGKLTLDEVLAHLDLLDTERRAHATRLQAMCEAARDRVGIEAMSRQFREAGFQTGQPGELHAPEDGRLLGWVLRAQH